MRHLLEQIKKGLDNNLYYLSLFAALALPDICGAINSESGEANKDKYVQWFNKYVAGKYRGFWVEKIVTILDVHCYIRETPNTQEAIIRECYLLNQRLPQMFSIAIF